MFRHFRWTILGLALCGGVVSAQDRKPPEPAKKEADDAKVPQSFTWNNMLLAWIKLSDDFEYSERRIDSYMQVARPETWNDVRNNEFKLKKARGETLDLLKKRVDGFKVDGEFVLANASMTFGKYDFKQKHFPIENMTDTHYWYCNAERFPQYLPNQFHAYFTNTKAFAGIKMDEEAAEAFIKERTNRFGDIERAIVGSIRFKIKKLKDGRDGEFLCEIVSMTIYGDRNKTKVIAEMPAPAKAKKDN